MSTNGVNTASFYADFGALSALKKDVKGGNDPQAIREAARQFESLFTDMMLKAMREAKLGDGLGDSEESHLYQDMYDQQLALQMSQGKGLGLADLLVQQLTRSAATTSATATSPTGAPSGAASGASSASSTASAPATAMRSPAPASAPAATHAQKISFVQMLMPYAQRAGAQLGIAPDSLIAQAALETGWGQHVPSDSGGSSNNLFGVKAGGGWHGASVASTTLEYEQGAPLNSTQSFRAYSSLQQGMNDYVSLLQRAAALQPALGTGADVTAFASALQRGGYATDPRYAAKLTATAGLVQSLRTHVQAAALKVPVILPKTSGGESA
jgi:flagellar protein FlgJ